MQSLWELQTGWTEEGPDLGSGDIVFFKKPEVLVVMNMPTDANSYGEIFYLVRSKIRCGIHIYAGFLFEVHSISKITT